MECHPPKSSIRIDEKRWNEIRGKSKCCFLYRESPYFDSAIEIKTGAPRAEINNGEYQPNGEVLHCLIELSGTISINQSVCYSIREACTEIKTHWITPSATQEYWEFTCRNYQETLPFLSCISLINKYSPIGPDNLSSMQKLLLGYAVKGDAEINLTPIIAFLMIMKDFNFPQDITQQICSDYVGDSIEFDSCYAQRLRKDTTRPMLSDATLKGIAAFKLPPTQLCRHRPTPAPTDERKPPKNPECIIS